MGWGWPIPPMTATRLRKWMGHPAGPVWPGPAVGTHQSTVTEKVVACCSDPDVALTVMV